MWIPKYLIDVDQFTDVFLIWICCGLYGVLFLKRLWRFSICQTKVEPSLFVFEV